MSDSSRNTQARMHSPCKQTLCLRSRAQNLLTFWQAHTDSNVLPYTKEMYCTPACMHARTPECHGHILLQSPMVVTVSNQLMLLHRLARIKYKSIHQMHFFGTALLLSRQGYALRSGHNVMCYGVDMLSFVTGDVNTFHTTGTLCVTEWTYVIVCYRRREHVPHDRQYRSDELQKRVDVDARKRLHSTGDKVLWQRSRSTGLLHCKCTYYDSMCQRPCVTGLNNVYSYIC